MLGFIPPAVSDVTISKALSELPVLAALVIAAGFVGLTAVRPALGCGLFALLDALTTGMGRGTVIPILRVNEAILAALLAGIALRRLNRWERRPISALDLAFGSFAIGTIVIAFLVLLVSRSSDLTSLDTMRNVLAPAQLLAVYLIFSRTEFSSRGLVTILNFMMLASVAVGLIATAELLDFPGVRDFIANFYPPSPAPPPWDPIYRPTSTLAHYSAVGAFGAINFTLALALAAMRHPGFNRAWLVLVMAVNLAALVSSLTWAPLLVLPLVAAIVIWQARRIPRELGVVLAALALAFVIAWPSVEMRSTQQDVFSAGQSFVIPQTFAHRIDLWTAFFIPALSDHLWLGSGTVIPGTVPNRLVLFVDNEYLREGYRAGLVGIALLLVMLVTLAMTGWRARRSPDPTLRSLAATSLALVVFFGLIGVTAEYLFFGGVSQEFAILTGLLSGLSSAALPVAREWKPRLAPALSPAL